MSAGQGVDNTSSAGDDYVLHAMDEDSSSSDEGSAAQLTEPHNPNPASRRDIHDETTKRKPISRWQKILLRRWKLILLSILPVVLMVFGIIHLVLVIAGGSRFYWTLNDDKLLPGWGLPGHLGAGLAEYPTDVTRDVLPIPVHSHNDYWRRIPLFDALYWGCTSVEADVWRFDDDDELYVGHKPSALSKNRTFRNLYVDPIVGLLSEMNKPGSFHDGQSGNESWHGVFDRDPDQTLVLLVDLKTSGVDTLKAVSSQLAPLRSSNHLSYWDGNQLNMRAVTVVSSGNTPFEQMMGASEHPDIFIDAPLEDLSSADYNSTNSYYASVSFSKVIGHVWNGRLSSKQMNIIRSQIAEAHKRGLKARYWNTPGWPVNLRNYLWDVLMSEGADVLNADDLKAAASSDWRRRIHGLWY